MIKKIFIVIIFSVSIYAQNENPIIAIGDSLVGKVINGESIRELHGNVILTQGKVRITCDKAIQYLAKNEAELIGKVVVTQDSIEVKTSKGKYFGNTQIAFSDAGINLTDGHVKLKSKKGYYYFEEKRSYFFDNVTLEEGITKLFTDKLNYYDNDDKAIAVGNVVVQDTASVLLADSLIYLRQTKFTDAYNNIRLYNSTNNISLFCDRLNDDGIKKISTIWGTPLLLRIEKTEDKADTLVVSSIKMEAYNDSTNNKLIAKENVRINQNMFSSINSNTVFYQNNDSIEIIKQEEDTNPPIIWYDNAQLIGDSIYIYIKNKRLKEIQLKNNSSIISENENYNFRYDQISGKRINIYFGNDNIELTEVFRNVLSIYYVFDDGKKNGLIKSSSETARIYFQDKEVSDVKLFGKPQSEYFPENIIEGKEKEFTIPTFKIYENRPSKDELLSIRKNILFYLEKDKKYNVTKSQLKK
ncbi:MAG: LPS export ABC transporter periplasmic protein LptC [Melioribacteraceae bacterium]|nr:LPS export ABC transporter periplasmic protein LptC [Melioribacteraceae bacterium]